MTPRICLDTGLMRSLFRTGYLATILLTSGCVFTGPMEWIGNGLKVGPNYARPPALWRRIGSRPRTPTFRTAMCKNGGAYSTTPR